MVHPGPGWARTNAVLDNVSAIASVAPILSTARPEAIVEAAFSGQLDALGEGQAVAEAASAARGTSAVDAGAGQATAEASGPGEAGVGCFAAGTLVSTDQGLKPIEKIQANDRVWSYDFTSGNVELRTVSRTFVHQARGYAVLQIGQATITATLEHPFWVENVGWKGAGHLQPGDLIQKFDGSSTPVRAVQFSTDEITVYNFEVQHTHAYFVSSEGLLVHNSCGMTPPGGGAAGSAGARSSWTPTEFQGNRVYQRNDLIDPSRVDARGRSNLDRMQQGLAPIGSDGKSINLHHTIQTNDSPLVEITATMHQQNSAILHINPNTVPSGIDRSAFDTFREEYWINRAKDFAP
jgi:hypothetical protein